MRIKLDENLPVQIKCLFVESGHNTDTVVEEGLGGAPDARVAAACIGDERVLVTLDLDFSDIRTYIRLRNAPVSSCSGFLAARDALLEVPAGLIERMEESFAKGQLWIVEDTRVRIRM